MLTAGIGTLELDLSNDFSIEIIKVSQLFNFDKLRGDCITAISFPATERNSNIFNHPNRFEFRRATGSKKYEGFWIRSDGFPVIEGTLELTDGFSGNVYGAVGALSASQEGLLITDATLPTAQTFSNKTAFDPATDDYCAPELVNPDFFKDIGVTAPYKLEDNSDIVFEETIMQHYHRASGYAVNMRGGEDTVFVSSNTILTEPSSLGEGAYAGSTNVITPMLYLFPTLEKILKSLKFFLDSSDISDDTELTRLCIYNNLTLMDYQQASIGSGYTFYETVTGELVATFQVIWYSQAIKTFDYTSLLPRITLKEFLISIQNLLNIVFVFSGRKYSIVDREAVLTGTAVDDNTYFTGNWKLKGKKSSIIKFTMVHDENDSLFSTYYQDLTERAADFGADVANYATLQALTNNTIGELRRVLSKHMVYEWNNWTITDENGTEKNVLQWKFVSLDFQPVKYTEATDATDTIEINTTASTVPFLGTGQAKQLGRCNLRKDTEAGFSLRLVFDQSNIGKNNSSSYMLNWRYTNNLLETRWPRTAAWLANREAVEGYFRFPVNIYANYNVNTKHHTRAGEFIIDRMVTRFTHAGIGETKIEGWKK